MNAWERVIGGAAALVDKAANALAPLVRRAGGSVSSGSELGTVLPELRAKVAELVRDAAAEGIRLAVTSGTRSMAAQAALYAQGRTAPGLVVTHARPGDSAHNYAAAVDVAPLDAHGRAHWPDDDALWTRIGEIGERHGLAWGGRWKGLRDRPHFELPDWRALRPVA